MKVRKKFYVGACNILDSDWPCVTEAEAVRKAKEVLDDDPFRDSAVVVKIVKVVRRGMVPYVVESV